MNITLSIHFPIETLRQLTHFKLEQTDVVPGASHLKNKMKRNTMTNMQKYKKHREIQEHNLEKTEGRKKSNSNYDITKQNNKYNPQNKWFSP